MKRIAILGCENSHADAFLSCIRNNEKFADVEVIGVYSDEPEASERLHQGYGVPVLASYGDALGKIDALVITARHGDNHFTGTVDQIIKHDWIGGIGFIRIPRVHTVIAVKRQLHRGTAGIESAQFAIIFKILLYFVCSSWVKLFPDLSYIRPAGCGNAR